MNQMALVLRAVRLLPAVACACASVCFLSGCGSDDSEATPLNGAAAQTNSSTQPQATTAARPEFQKLLGKWARSDGDYLLELRTVDASGKMEAGYFNPGPINVSRALAIQEGQTTKVFVELQDVSYPGCTYSLTYDSKFDQLYGQYFQAAVQQTYDITFARLK